MSYNQECSVLPLWLSITYLLLYLMRHHAMLPVPLLPGPVLDEAPGRLGENHLLQESTQDPGQQEFETPSGLE